MAAVIAISIKMVGLLLITGMLIIPAAMARNISDSPQKMVVYSIIGGLLSVILGLLAHSSLAIGLVVIGFLTFIRFDIMGLLFGDILAVTVDDLLIIWIGGPLILLVLKLIWNPLFLSLKHK